MMRRRGRSIEVWLWLVIILSVSEGSLRTGYGAQRNDSTGLKIVVIAGEDAINVIQQKTAVAPVVEVHDRNDQPVAGALVRFAIQGGRATFGGARTLTVTTNLAGRAAVTSLTPTGSGVFQITATASFQGQTAAAVIAQTNVLTAAQAAQIATTSSAGTSGGGAGAGGAAAGGSGGGLSATTIGVLAGAAAGGTLAVKELTGPTRYTGEFSGSEALSFGGVFCRTEAMTGTLTMDLDIASDGNVTGEANISGSMLATSTSPGCSSQLNTTDAFPMRKAPVTGTSGSMSFSKAQSNNYPPGPNDPTGGVNTNEFTFSGALNQGAITGTLFHRRIINNVVAGTIAFTVTLR